MAATGLLALLDDMASLLDDIATMSKVAARKTAGLAGDDLAVNAEVLVGLSPKRELPIVGKVALGSCLNKLVLIPLALLLPAKAITPLLMLGGAFLCYEGLHKALHRKGEDDEQHRRERLEAMVAPTPDSLKALEAKKVKQAIVTDFILSAEIVAVTLGAVAAQPLATRAGVLVVVAYGMTFAIYGLVAGLVKLDDIGLHLQKSADEQGSLRYRAGTLLVEKTPLLMKGISVLGTLAMFMVGGGIILHGIPGAEAWLARTIDVVGDMVVLKSVLGVLAPLVVGVLVGALTTGLVALGKKAWGAVTNA